MNQFEVLVHLLRPALDRRNSAISVRCPMCKLASLDLSWARRPAIQDLTQGLYCLQDGVVQC